MLGGLRRRRATTGLSETGQGQVGSISESERQSACFTHASEYYDLSWQAVVAMPSEPRIGQPL